MPSFSLLALFCTVAAAAVLPRHNVPSGSCCFNLYDDHTGAIVQQDKPNGDLYFNSKFPAGWYCIDLADSRNILFDDFGNACFLRPNSKGQSVGELVCLDPTPGFNSWTLSSTNRLQHDGITTWWSCPSPTSGNWIYGQVEGSTSSCKQIRLKAKGFQGTCGKLTTREEMEKMA
ncbi:Fc.00g102820.m01.CDS01 [Cosmosporella sp. VM-42]